MKPHYENCRMSRLIDCHIHNERNRRILKRRLLDGVKYDAIAAEFGLSRNQIFNICKAGRDVLFPLLDNDAGVD